MKDWKPESKTITYKKSANGFDYTMNRTDFNGKLIELKMEVSKTLKEGDEDTGEVLMRSEYKASQENLIYPPVSISFQPHLTKEQVGEMIAVMYEGM